MNPKDLKEAPKRRNEDNPANFFPNVLKQEDLSYDTYLKVSDLTSLQHPQSEPPHHDEMLFIIIHQAFELWFKLVKHELQLSIECMQKNKVLQAAHYLQRSTQVIKTLINQLHILETMTPHDFLQFRDRLNPASGFQSIQFREVEFMVGLKEKSYLKYFANRPEQSERLEKRYHGPDLKQTYWQVLNQSGFDVGNGETSSQVMPALLEVYSHREKHLPLYLLTEALVDLDEGLCLWRDHHVRVVERIIGYKQGTGGSKGVEYLRSVTSRKAFPFLWEVRTHLQKN